MTTDDDLFDELMGDDSLILVGDIPHVRASEEVATARVNACISCEFYSNTVCVKGNFGVFRQAANESGKCPEGKW